MARPSEDELEGGLGFNARPQMGQSSLLETTRMG